MKKLKKILLINWLYFSKELIEVNDINFLTGKNAAGKSTIIDALQIVLVGETNARNFNQAANEKSQRTLDGYLRADMDENNPNSRRAKDFSSFIACEFWDDMEGKQFVCGIIFDCRSDGSRTDRFFIYDGALPEDRFVRQGEAIDIPTLRIFLKTYGTHGKLYDTHEQYQKDLLAKWNVHNKQVMRMMKKAISFRPIVDIQKFITENICDIPEKPDIQAMQQNIRDYKRHEQLAQRQEEKLEALRDIGRRYRDWQQAIDRWRIQSFLSQWAKKEAQKSSIHRSEQESQDCKTALTKAEEQAQELNDQITQTETRKRELELAVAQSNVYKEKEKLSNQKQQCIQENQRLTAGLEGLAQNIRVEVSRVGDLCEKISVWDEREELERVKHTAEKVEKAYTAFQKGEIAMFSSSLALFEKAQTATAELSSAVRDAAHKVEDQLEQYKEEEAQKRVVLANLRKNIKDYLSLPELDMEQTSKEPSFSTRSKDGRNRTCFQGCTTALLSGSFTW